jgi:acetyl esterase/lipase
VVLGSEWREETLALNEQIRALMAQLPAIESVPPAVTRRSRYEGSGIFGPPVFVEQARWEDWDGVRVRVFEPEAAKGTYLHLHGGGWTIGAADLQDPLLWRLAEATGLIVASVEYRLAPEHPHPAGVEDCVAAARYLQRSGLPGPYTIGGESAGAHLSICTLLQVEGFVGANLSYGAYDLSGTPSRRAYRDTLVLTDESMEWFTSNFLPDLDLEQRRDPAISPLYADLIGMPPALFTVGSLDPLLDDSRFLAAIWPNEYELHVWDSAPHGFNVFPVQVSLAANEAQAAFLSRVTAAAS